MIIGRISLTSWQKSYGPTKLELLGVVTSIVDNSSYLRGNKFILECDHQALRPLFQNKFKGAIYDRWLAVLQQYNFEIRYKPASQMQVADALSRYPDTSFVENRADDSPDEKDPYFPYMEEVAGNIIFKQDEKAQFIAEPHDQINTIRLQEECDPGYFADTENEPTECSGNDCISVEIRRNSCAESSVSELLVDISESNGNDSITVNSSTNAFLPDRNGHNSISMNTTPHDDNSDNDLFPQINLQLCGDPELFVEKYTSEGGIDSNSPFPLNSTRTSLKAV